MLKKTIIILGITTSSLLFAGLNDTHFKKTEDMELIKYNKKINQIKLGDIFKSNEGLILYADKKWYKAVKVGEIQYYIQKDPLTDQISKIKIVNPYTEFETGRDLKNLSIEYGIPKYVNNKAVFTSNDLKIRLFVDKDSLSKKDQDMSIIEMTDISISKQKSESENKIYRESRMMRHN